MMKSFFDFEFIKMCIASMVGFLAGAAILYFVVCFPKIALAVILFETMAFGLYLNFRVIKHV